MKKILSLLLCLCCIFTLNVPIYAAASDNVLVYDLSSGGNHEISVKTGDIITVVYTINASERCSTLTTQNQIVYDHRFFELVPGSISKSGDYSMAFATSSPVDSDGTHYIYYNSVSSVTFIKDKPAEIGSFQLKVIGSAGSSYVASSANFATDKDAKLYGSSREDLKVNVIGSPQHVHVGVLQAGRPAQEGVAGYEAYYRCSCNKYYEDAACTVEIPDIVAWKSVGGNGYIKPLIKPDAPKTSEDEHKTSEDEQNVPNEKVAVELLKASHSGKTALKLSWNKVAGATKYVVYGNIYGKNSCKKLKTTTARSYTVKKVNGKKLKAQSVYKFYVIAKTANGNVRGKTIYFIFKTNKGKYANVKTIKVKQETVTLKVGETAKVGAKYTMYNGKKHLPTSYGKDLRFRSDCPAVATVSSTGVVTANSAGTATIYIQDIGGKYCKTTVTVCNLGTG